MSTISYGPAYEKNIILNNVTQKRII